MSQMSRAIAKMKLENESSVILQPFQLSPDQVTKSPNGVAFDVLIKPPSCEDGKVIPVTYSPSENLQDFEEKTRSAEIRKKIMLDETTLRQQQHSKKINNARRKILENIDNQQKQVIERVQKKTHTVEKLVETQKKLLEEKKEARELRALEAKKVHEEILKSKQKQAESKLERQRIADANREATIKAKIEKAATNSAKTEVVRASQQKKLEELEEKVHQNLIVAGEKRQAKLAEIKEKCSKHVEDAKKRAANVEKKSTSQTEESS